MISLLQRIERKHWLVIGLLALGTALCAQNLAFYLKFNFNLFIVLLVVPFVMFVKYPGTQSIRFAVLSLIFLALYPFLKVQSCFFLGYAFFLLFVFESQLGRLSNLPLFLVAVLSPFCIFVFELIGFPLRLQLTELSAQFLSATGMDVTATGSLLLIDGQEFGVDPECMGLKMVISSFLVCMAFIAYREKKYKQQISFMTVVALFVVTSVLILLCNLFRIIGIVMFKAPPDTFTHEAVGLIALAIYVIIPLYYLVMLAGKLNGRPIKRRQGSTIHPLLNYGLMLVLLVGLGIFNYHRDKFRNVEEDAVAQAIELPGFRNELVENGVTKLTGDDALIYIKPSSNFYGAHHSPLICWKGSGYKFKNERLVKVGENMIYFAELRSEDDKLFTAWWFDNGVHKTAEQLDWRWRMMKGEEPFRLINVTCKSADKLMTVADEILNRNFF